MILVLFEIKACYLEVLPSPILDGKVFIFFTDEFLFSALFIFSSIGDNISLFLDDSWPPLGVSINVIDLLTLGVYG